MPSPRWKRQKVLISHSSCETSLDGIGMLGQVRAIALHTVNPFVPHRLALAARLELGYLHYLLLSELHRPCFCIGEAAVLWYLPRILSLGTVPRPLPSRFLFEHNGNHHRSTVALLCVARIARRLNVVRSHKYLSGFDRSSRLALLLASFPRPFLFPLTSIG